MTIITLRFELTEANDNLKLQAVMKAGEIAGELQSVSGIRLLDVTDDASAPALVVKARKARGPNKKKRGNPVSPASEPRQIHAEEIPGFLKCEKTA